MLVSQLIAKADRFDTTEVRIMMLINFAYLTPVLFWFYSYLAKFNLSFIARLLIDQLLFSPLLTAGIVGLRLYLQGATIQEIPMMVIAVVPTAMKSSWLFWFPSRAIIMLYVPSMYQLLANNAFALVWNIIFATILRNN